MSDAPARSEEAERLFCPYCHARLPWHSEFCNRPPPEQEIIVLQPTQPPKYREGRAAGVEVRNE